MPNFNVLTINETHLAKVLCEKRSVKSINETLGDNNTIYSFIKWRNYVTKQIRDSKSLISLRVEHIFS